MRAKPYTADELALIKQLIDRGLTLYEALPHFPGRTRDAIHEAARRNGWHWTPAIDNRTHPLELRDKIRRVWEATDYTAVEIGEMFGMTKNAIVGLANRHGWSERRRGKGTTRRPTTLEQRMAALHAMMDKVLRDNPTGKGRVADDAGR